MLETGPAGSRLLRYLWALPGTLLGLPFLGVAILTGGRVFVRRGIVEVHGGVVAWLLRRCVPIRGGAAALTLGHVVLGRSAAALAESRSHERIHVRQYERWGPLFLPAYLLASLYLLLSRRDYYHENPFEREAFRLQ